MVPEIRFGCNTYFFLTLGQSLDAVREKPETAEDTVLDLGADWKALAFLRSVSAWDLGLQILRQVAFNAGVDQPWRYQDVDLLDILAAVISTDRIAVIDRYQPGGAGASAEEESQTAPVAHPAAASLPAAPPEPEDADTFGPDVHQDRQAAGLVAASRNGVPFCEECAARTRAALRAQKTENLAAPARDFAAEPEAAPAAEASQTKSAGEDSKTKDNRIDIVFDPDKSTKVTSCSKIVHVQFIRITVDGVVTKPGDFVASFKYRDAVMTKDGWWIDHLQTEKTPDYQQGTTAGTNGNKTGAGSTKATIVDVPNIGGDTVKGPYDAATNTGGWKTVVFDFFTYAWCMQGTDCGKWYEGVKWQYTKTAAQQKAAGGTGTSTILDNDVSPPPSASNIEAFDSFNKAKGFKPCP